MNHGMVSAWTWDMIRRPIESRGFPWRMPGWCLGLAWLVWAAWGGVTVRGAEAETSPNLDSVDSVRLLEFAGRVEYASGADGDWQPAVTNRVLVPGDRLRTGPSSRATLQFSDRSVFRVNQSSQVEIRPRVQETGWRELFLRVGELFFLDRERPARIGIRTPTTTSAIRGTEFVMGVEAEDGTVRLAVMEGAVSLASAEGSVEVGARQEGIAMPGRAPEVRPLLEARARVQWCLHYPGVLVPEELEWTPGEAAGLAASVRAYRAGDVLTALAESTGLDLGSGASPDARLYVAGLHLATGQVGPVEEILAEPGIDRPAARALRRVMAAVQGDGSLGLSEPGTASEWLAKSYQDQARSDLVEALRSVRAAEAVAPDSGYVRVRRGELEWGFGRRALALEALRLGRERSPRNPMGSVLAGFIEIERGRTDAASAHFEEARRVDGAMAEAWLGLGLVAERRGEREAALAALQTAAALAPNRAILRAYLGKGWAAAGDRWNAAREFDLAIELDPNDPTGWYYRGLERQQTHQLNRSVDDLGTAVQKNDGRSVFRSGLRLDQDRSMRQADLSVTYSALGMVEVGERAASRAIVDDYGDFAAHLYRARMLLRYREDPGRFDLRYEAARRSHLLVANLLAPPEGANLSQDLSQQDRLRPFDGGMMHGSSLTTYRSAGDWEETASLFGNVGGVAYALDGRYARQRPDEPVRPRETGAVAATLKQRLGDRDDLYVQAGWLWREGGDPTRLMDPGDANTGFRLEESQTPFVHLGWHREWAPGSHTLALGSYVDDELTIDYPQASQLFVRMSGTEPRLIRNDPFFDQRTDSRFRLGSVELQQIYETEQHAVVVGGRYQRGEFEVRQELERRVAPGMVPVPEVGPGYEDAGGYAYYTYRPWRTLRWVAGVAYDEVRYPANVVQGPVSGEERRHSQWSPKVGVQWAPWTGGQLRAAYARSVGGQDFAQSLRLEPVEVAGFVQAHRNVAPMAVAGVLTGLPRDVVGVGFDQEFATRTYAGFTVEQLRTSGDRRVGALRNATLQFIPDEPISLVQDLEYREETVSAYVHQLWGDRWVTGVRYTLSRADFATSYPELPSQLAGLPDVTRDERAVLGQLELSAGFNHESGVYARWASVFHHQTSESGGLGLPSETFWQHDVWVGYRFPRRRAELRLGILNLTDEDYRLNPLNEYRPIVRTRTFEAALRINF